MNAVDALLALFSQRGDDAYFGEPVTQTEHALQTAWLASGEGASPALIVAALLHDVGHLLHQRGEDVADHGIDARHEIIGAKWLSRFFTLEVTEPIRLHVAAKRYLCRIDSTYAAALSPASQRSLILQGGAFSADEAKVFEGEAYWQSAVRLRRWDEAAKLPDLKVDPLEHFRPQIQLTLTGPGDPDANAAEREFGSDEEEPCSTSK